jgi:hypothetical protein
VRVAARLRRELQTDVEMIHGRYGEFKVLVDGKVVEDGGSAAFLGVLPSSKKIVGAVRKHLVGSPEAAPDLASQRDTL